MNIKVEYVLHNLLMLIDMLFKEDKKFSADLDIEIMKNKDICTIQKMSIRKRRKAT